MNNISFKHNLGFIQGVKKSFSPSKTKSYYQKIIKDFDNSINAEDRKKALEIVGNNYSIDSLSNNQLKEYLFNEVKLVNQLRVKQFNLKLRMTDLGFLFGFFIQIMSLIILGLIVWKLN